MARGRCHTWFSYSAQTARPNVCKLLQSGPPKLYTFRREVFRECPVHTEQRRFAALPLLELPISDAWGLWAVLAASASAAQVLLFSRPAVVSSSSLRLQSSCGAWGPKTQCLHEITSQVWRRASFTCTQTFQESSRIGRLVSAPLAAILVGVALAAAGVVPLECTTYDVISTYLLPLAAALYLLESDLTELAATARESFLAFLLASLGTIIGTVFAWWMLGTKLGPDGWKVAACLAASYVGGSVNFAATAAALDASSGGLLAAAMSADMVAMAVYLAIISWWPVDPEGDAATDIPAAAQHSHEVRAVDLGAGIAAAAAACALGSAAAAMMGIPGFSLGLVAVFASAIASIGSAGTDKSDVSTRTSLFRGSEALGGALMSLFFVTIGAAAGSFGTVLSAGWLLAFIAVQLGAHLAVTVGLGRMAGLPTRALLTASNAAIGGPGTAAAMATSRGWTALVRPALVIGAFGYSIGTTVGVSIGHAIRP